MKIPLLFLMLAVYLLHSCAANAAQMHADDWRAELQQGEELTRSAHFAEAIPHLRQALASGNQPYPSGFNLALCYVGVDRYKEAEAELHNLQAQGNDTALVENLLAQTYLGETQPEKAWAAITAAVRLTPTDERMYALLMDACTEHYQDAMGLRVAELGLLTLPGSARLHYERAVFLAKLDRLEEARPEFATAARLGQATDVGHLAVVQADLYDDRFSDAAATARAAIAAGDRSAEMLSLLGGVLLQGGAVPGQPQFEEARRALLAATQSDPNDASAQIALGSLYLREGQAATAVPHLEIGERLEPNNPAVYTQLAAAYRKTGNTSAAMECITRLRALLKERDDARASTKR